METKEAIVTKLVNIRVGKPSVNAPKAGTYQEGNTFAYVDEVFGDEFEDSSTWLRLSNNTYVWAGATNLPNRIDFKLEHHIYEKRTLDLPRNKMRLTRVKPAIVQPDTPTPPNIIGNGQKIAQHPFMNHGIGMMHEDTYSSDANPFSAVTGSQIQAYYYHFPGLGGLCPAFLYTNNGQDRRMFCIGFKLGKGMLLELDPENMQLLSATKLPPKKVKVFRFFIDPDSGFKDASGGAYYILDNGNRLLVPTSDNDILILEKQDGRFCVKKENIIPMSEQRNELINKDDALYAVMPTWDDQKLFWYTTKLGMVGIVDIQNKRVLKTVKLKTYEKEKTQELYDPNTGTWKPWNKPPLELPEEIQNSFSMDETGLYVATTKGMYKLSYDVNTDELKTDWRCRYDPGIRLPSNNKPGQMTIGTGTTPTLVDVNGKRYVAICDGTEVMKIWLFHCEFQNGQNIEDLSHDKQVAARIEVFTDRSGGACENSMVGFNGELFLGNTFGYTSPFTKKAWGDAWVERHKETGALKINIAEAITAYQQNNKEPVDAKDLTQGWYYPEADIGSAVPKLSTHNGLIYMYHKAQVKGKWWWCLTGRNWSDGKPALQVPLAEPCKRKMLVGNSQKSTSRHYDFWDNAWATFSIAPTGGIHIGMFRGLMYIRDEEVPNKTVPAIT